MKIALAQVQPKKGDIKSNLELHEKIIALADSKDVDAIFFPELSITGYEPKLAKDLAIHIDNKRLDSLAKISESSNMIIGIGCPYKRPSGTQIAMLILYPDKKRKIYAKQILHEDEEPYFINGTKAVTIQLGQDLIAPAICYESLQVEHANKAMTQGATIYLASVAKAQNRIAEAYKYFPELAKNNAMPILMCNAIGPSDDFVCAGKSAIWHKNGNPIGQLSKDQEGILIYDSDTESAKSLAVANSL